MSLAAGILVHTLFGPKPVEKLVSGDMVLAESRMPRPLLTLVTKRLRPSREEGPLVMIRPGALGRGCPGRSLIVTPGQLIDLPRGGRLPAERLIDGRKVLRIWPRRSVVVHQPILADGAPFLADGLWMASPRLSPGLTQRLAARLPRPISPMMLTAPAMDTGRAKLQH